NREIRERRLRMAIARARNGTLQLAEIEPSQGVTAPGGGLAVTGYRSLGEMLDADRELAERVTIAPQVLAEWYARQVAHQRAYLGRIEQAMKAAMADPKLEDRESPAWKTYWRLDARYRYASETLGL